MSRRPKARAHWFQARASWPNREIPAARLGRALDAAAQVPSPRVALPWKNAGPTNIGGRMTCAVVHPGQRDTLWAGAANGGIWKTTDAGHSWRPLGQQMRSLAVGSLALDPQDPAVLYCGTGEANLSGDSHGGMGVFKSLDGGETWKHVASSETGEVPLHIGALAVDPFDSDHLFLGGLSFLEDQPSGLFESTDGGESWVQVHLFGRPTQLPVWCHHVLFHPTEEGTVWVTLTEMGSRNGIWRLGRSGSTWEHLTRGLPRSEEMDRATLALAPSDPEILYVLFDWQDHADAPEKRAGVFRSNDGGDHWSGRPELHFENEGQMYYDQALAVDPRDADRVLVGAIDLHLSEDGGVHWRRVSDSEAPRGQSDYAHADQHALLFDPHTSNRVYAFNDGGLDVSEAGGAGWMNRSRGLETVMYYDLAVSPADPQRFGGGTQDNGTVVTFDGSADRHKSVLGGDGGFMAFDSKIPDHYFVTAQELVIWRFETTGAVEVSPPVDLAEVADILPTILVLDPGDRQRLFTGGRRIWRTLNGGDHWDAVTESLDGSPVTAIELDSRSQGVYVGTENGGFFRSLDGGDTWSANLRGASLPGRTITRIRVDPQQGSNLYLAVAGFGHSHVYRSTNYGVTWQDLDQGRLPDAPCTALEIIDSSAPVLVVASHVGLFATEDGGVHWVRLSESLPNVCFTDVVYHRGSGDLFAATYGRGIWRLSLPKSLAS